MRDGRARPLPKAQAKPLGGAPPQAAPPAVGEPRSREGAGAEQGQRQWPCRGVGTPRTGREGPVYRCRLRVSSRAVAAQAVPSPWGYPLERRGFLPGERGWASFQSVYSPVNPYWDPLFCCVGGFSLLNCTSFFKMRETSPLSAVCIATIPTPGLSVNPLILPPGTLRGFA